MVVAVGGRRGAVTGDHSTYTRPRPHTRWLGLSSDSVSVGILGRACFLLLQSPKQNTRTCINARLRMRAARCFLHSFGPTAHILHRIVTNGWDRARVVGPTTLSASDIPTTPFLSHTNDTELQSCTLESTHALGRNGMSIYPLRRAPWKHHRALHTHASSIGLPSPHLLLIASSLSCHSSFTPHHRHSTWIRLNQGRCAVTLFLLDRLHGTMGMQC